MSIHHEGKSFSDLVSACPQRPSCMENQLLTADCFGGILDALSVEGPHPQHFLDQLATSALTCLTVGTYTRFHFRSTSAIFVPYITRLSP
jgi:hypothetical protein